MRPAILRAKYGLHALRHFFASYLIDQGFPPKKVQALMGHSYESDGTAGTRPPNARCRMGRTYGRK
jgi:integrase